MRYTGRATEYATSAMHSDMAFSACAQNRQSTAAASANCAGTASSNTYGLVRDTALAVSLFVLLMLVVVEVAVFGVLALSVLLVLSILAIIYIIDVRIIIPNHGKANVELSRSRVA